MMTPTLTVIKDGQIVKTLILEGEALIGRGKDCAIHLNERALSRHHALFKVVNQNLQVEKKTEFGVLLVNGKESGAATLKEGDIVSLGPYLVQVSFPSSSPASSKTDAQLNSQPAIVRAAPEKATGDEDKDNSLHLEGDNASLQGSNINNENKNGEIDLGLESSPDGQPEVESENVLETEGGSESAVEMPDSGDQFESGSEEGDATDNAVDLGDGKTQITTKAKVTVKLVFKPGTANHTEYPLTKAEVSIGRGRDCDIVLEDKKASRKNTVILRTGIHFVIKDLDSVNGTFVNGKKITEHQLSGDDKIRVGGVEFQFIARSEDYARNEKDFASAPVVLEDENHELALDLGEDVADTLTGASPESLSGGEEAGGALDLNLGGPAGEGTQPTPMKTGAAQMTSGFQQEAGTMTGLTGAIPGLMGTSGSGKKKTLLERFRALPKRTQMIAGVAAALFLMWVMEEDEQPTDKKKGTTSARTATASGTRPSQGATPGPSPVASGSAGAGNSLAFEQLPADQRRFIENEHALAFEYYKNKEYDKALFEIAKIFALIPDYKDTRELEKYAKEGKKKLEVLEEEKRKREEEAALKAKINRLVEEIRGFMDQKNYDQARTLFADILALDPDNAAVADWRREIQASEEAKRIEEQKKKAQEAVNAQGWDYFKEALALRKQHRYIDAIQSFERIFGLTLSDKSLEASTKKMITRCKLDIKRKVTPIIEEAKQLEQAGTLIKAFDLFKKATRIDPQVKAGYAGMNRIREVLHGRARSAYVEAVLAESYSDFETAKKLFNEIIGSTPQDDVYYQRAQRKLAHYLLEEEVQPQ